MIREQLSLFPHFSVSPYSRPKGDLTKMPKTGSRREAVLRQIIKAGKRGITDDELLSRLLLSSEQLHKARLELMEGGYVEDSTRTRNTHFGDPTVVWIASDFAEQQWQQTGRH